MFVPTVIDLSRIPAPNAVEPLDFETLYAAFIARFKLRWEAARALNPDLPSYDVDVLEYDPAAIVGQAFSDIRLTDRGRVNDAIEGVLAPLASLADLDNVVARANVQRLVVTPAANGVPDILETDDQLRRRYLLTFDQPSAGSRDCYLARAFAAWPGMLDAAVVGRADRVLAGYPERPGDTDIVIIGPNGDAPTTTQIGTVRDAVTATNVKPEAVRVTVIAAKRVTYTVNLTLDIPGGADAGVVAANAKTAVQTAANGLMRVGAQAPIWAFAGKAYTDNVMKVTVNSPSGDIPADPYSVPVCTGITITTQVKQ